ncbi:MAG: tRNA modification GTPase [Planctomycetaceae bacterium]
MVPLVDDTIAALASAPGHAVNGIVRLSGDVVRTVLDGAFRPDRPADWSDAKLPRSHSGELRVAALPVPVPVDVLFWPSRRSYTGRPMAEIHTVGSPPVLEAVLAEVYRRGARPAEPGEFTLRAFLSGRIDLVQAEAVMGVIDSLDQIGLERALRQLAGGISGRIAKLHADLLDLLADLEAGLDFVEEDVEFVPLDEVLRRLTSARTILEELKSQSAGRMVSTGRIRAVLAGLPNAGKSTLFNALAGEASALVSAERGTTRDYLCAELDWDGFAVLLIDTAGWDSPSAGVASQAQQFREEQLGRAEVVVWCTAADIEAGSRRRDARLRRDVSRSASRMLHVRTKSDLAGPTEEPFDLSISAVTGTGLTEFQACVHRSVSREPSRAGGLLGTTAARCQRSLREALDALRRAASATKAALGDELIAAELRDAIDALGQIVGAVYTDDLLDRIFSKFCIGK